MDDIQSKHDHRQRETLCIVGIPGKTAKGKRGRTGYLICFRGQQKFLGSANFGALVVISVSVRGRINRDFVCEEVASKLSTRTEQGIRRGISTDALRHRCEKLNEELGEEVITWFGMLGRFNLDDNLITFESAHLVDHPLSEVREALKSLSPDSLTA